MVVARAAGRSALRSLIAPVLVALLLGGMAVGAFNPIVAATSTAYESQVNRFKSGVQSTLSISEEGIWLRQGGETGQTVIHAERANLDGTVLSDVTFIEFGPSGSPVQRIQAEDAALSEGMWLMSNAKSWPLTAGVNPELQSQLHDTLAFPSTLTREQIRDSFGTPSSVPIWELPRFIQQLTDAGFSARCHQVWLHMELASPAFLVAMVLIGAAFTIRHTRMGRTGVMVLTAVMLGFGLYFIRNFAQILGENGQIPVLLAAWAPPLAAIFLALGLLLHLEDG
jgi:lipopolysaccharide export system permease protein